MGGAHGNRARHGGNLPSVCRDSKVNRQFSEGCHCSQADGSIILQIYYVRFTINCSLFRSFLFGEIRRHVNGHVTMKG